MAMPNGTRGTASKRDVMNYAMPQGPTSIGNRGPSLGGTNLGNCGTQCSTSTSAKSSGKVGLGGDRSMNGGMQGKR